MKDYQGILQTDDWQVYDKFADESGITLVDCLAHAHRKFHTAKDSYKTKSEQTLALFQQIYATDRKQKELPLDVQKHYREEYMRPPFEELKDWIDAELQSAIEIEKSIRQSPWLCESAMA